MLEGAAAGDGHVHSDFYHEDGNCGNGEAAKEHNAWVPVLKSGPPRQCPNQEGRSRAKGRGSSRLLGPPPFQGRRVYVGVPD